MEVEFLGRFPKVTKNHQDEEEIRLNRLLGNEEESKPEYSLQFEYSRIVLDIVKDITLYYKFDAEHTAVKHYDGEHYVLKCKYKQFKFLREYLSGNMVRSFESFKIEQQLQEKVEKVSAILNELNEESKSIE